MKKSLPQFLPWAVRCFEMVFLPLRKFHFEKIQFMNLPEMVNDGKPILLVGNHMSNWDGFIFWEIQKKLKPNWPVYSVMLEAELKKRPMFRLLGGVGIDPNLPASVLKAMRDLKLLRKENPNFFLSYFPQGKISPSFKRPLEFKSGVDLFIRALAPLTVIPVGLHIEAMKGLSPTLFASLGRPMKIERASSVHLILQDLVQKEIDRIHAMLCQYGDELPEHVLAPSFVKATK